MAQTLTCSRGHHWEAEAAGDAATLLCPVCGSAASVSAMPAATLPSADKSWPAAGPVVVPGYEILAELGRGGMGVVYKARDPKLNRVVALKMLTAGGHAGPDLLQRFQREAESLARLTHPNIVQIHEAGWAEPGGPFLTLEYVEGGSLSQKLARAPQPPRQAAETVAVLAGAVQFAHERGVLHRDLKPANVLLTADGTPKVTDFGLARFLQGELASGADSPTPTGAVLGTPSYMAPEQAGGVTRAPTTAVDVYALGAILYEMLTGRPPFLAEGPMETTLQVLTDDPVPPRRLRPNAPRDLETICLHCLRKNPRQRYATAAALADDLRRFLDGRPITVRPAGPVERLAKWARRRPAVATLLAVSTLAVLAGLGGAAWYQVQLYERNAALTKEKDLYNGLLVLSVDAMSEYGDAADEAVAPLPDNEQARRALLEKRLEFFKPFLDLAPDNPRLQRRKGRALFEVAKIHQKLGEAGKAEAEYRECIGLYERAGAGLGAAPVLRHDLGRACVQFGALLGGVGRGDEAAANYERGVGLLQGLYDSGDRDAAVRHDLAVAYHGLAMRRTAAKDWPGALDALARAIDLCRGLTDEYDKEDSYKVLLAGDYADRCGMYRLKGEAGPAGRDADAALEWLGRVDPARRGDEVYRDTLAGVHFHRGLLLGAAKHGDPLPDFETAARTWDGLAREHATVPRYRAEAAEAWFRAGRCDFEAGRLPDAEAALRRADELYSGLASGAEGRDASRYDLGLVLKREGKFGEAVKCFEDLVNRFPGNADYQEEYGAACLGWASGAEVFAHQLAFLPPVGLTVVPNPLGCFQGYVGHQMSALQQCGLARDRYRLALDRLRRAEQDGRDSLPVEERQDLALRRRQAALGLQRTAGILRDEDGLREARDELQGPTPR